MRTSNLAAIPGLLVLLAGQAVYSTAVLGDEIKIENRRLSVAWDSAAATLSVRQAGAPTPFLSSVRLGAGSGRAEVIAVDDPTFGRGSGLLVRHGDGSKTEIQLFDSLPLVLFRGDRHNSGAEPVVVSQASVLNAGVDLGKPAESLKVLGTGGLAEAGDRGSYMWMAVADPNSRRGVVGGWLTTERGSGVVLSKIDQGQLRLNAQLDYGRLRIAPGKSAELETIALGYFDDARLGLEAWADAVARVNRINLLPQPCAYCTWYHSGASNEKELAELSSLAAKELLPYGFSVVQIDDGWQEGDPKGNGPRKNFTAFRAEGPYAHGMKPTADDVRSKGLVPGIWFMPFAGTHNDPWFADHQEWFVHKADGSPYDTPWGGTCIDMTHPGARDYLRGIVRRLTAEWGYQYLKMDGLYTGCGVPQIYVNDAYRDDHIGDAVFHDPDKTNVEAYRSGLRLVRETAGPDVFLLGCCANQNMRSYGGAFGLVDAMRVGPDNGASWHGVLTGPRYGSRNYFLHGRVWYNDPDPIYVRTSLAVEECRVSCSWAGITGQLTLGSDDFLKLPPERLDILRRVMPAHGLQARPIDLFDESLPRIWQVTDTRRGLRHDAVGLFNWSEKPALFDTSLARLGLPSGGAYAAFDYWANSPLPPVREHLNVTVPARSCAILSIRALGDSPLLLSTSRHVSQGMVDVVEEHWDAAAHELSGSSRVVAGDSYELRLLPLTTGGLWKPAAAGISAEDQAAGVTVVLGDDRGVVRVGLRSPVSRTVRWKVRFDATPAAVPAPGTASSLKATMPDPCGSVLLDWKGTSPFYEILRDGTLLATGRADATFSDSATEGGREYRYAVVPLAWDGRRGEPVEICFKTPSLDPGPVPPLPEVSLATLRPRSVHVGWGKPGVGKSAAGSPLTLGKEVYQDGIGLHAHAEAVYDRKAEWKRFVAVVGIDESKRVDNQSSLACLVIAETGDKRTELARSPVLRFGKVERWHFNVPLPDDCQRIRLVVTEGGDNNKSDHADWVNAGFRKE